MHGSSISARARAKLVGSVDASTDGKSNGNREDERDEGTKKIQSKTENENNVPRHRRRWRWTTTTTKTGDCRCRFATRGKSCKE
mmetsp:Transcript_37209/g.80931  ORF Transcript_37209/g.80931 Transcript_37209/m.80931 type:complete len:84 (-) Transcript_37209:218-469(-)